MTSTSIPRPSSVAELAALVGVELGPTGWREVSQDTIAAFAAVTGDHQWIHLDPERAARSAFGSTIAHGLFTLSLGPALLGELISLDRFAHIVNYGYEKVRFPAPLPVGCGVQMRAVIRSADLVGPGAAHVVTEQIFERDGGGKPVCVALQASRFIEGSSS